MSVFKFDKLDSFNSSFDKFESQVFKKQPFVLLVYANWCGHCTHMRDNWDTAVKGAAENVVEVEFDVLKHLTDTHDDNHFVQILKDVKGFPSIMTVHKDTKASPTPFEKPRDLASFTEYLGKKKTKAVATSRKPREKKLDNIVAKYT